MESDIIHNTPPQPRITRYDFVPLGQCPIFSFSRFGADSGLPGFRLFSVERKCS
jgi:hypothetical protein